MSNYLSPVVGLFCVLFVGCGAKPNDYSEMHSDSGIYGRSYQEIRDELFNLEQSHTGFAKVISYGKTLLGQELTMLRIGKEQFDSSTKRPAVVIQGTIHGNEFLNIEDRLPSWFLENQNSPGVRQFLDAGGIIYITPILNPDGYDDPRRPPGQRVRENVAGEDLNRDFPLKAYAGNRSSLTQPETKSLVATIDQQLAKDNAKLTLSMDYHCCVGAILYPWSFSETKKLQGEARAEQLRTVKIMLQHFPNYTHGRAIEVVKYIPIGTSDDYFYETYGTKSYTFEGAYKREHLKFEKHTSMWDDLLADQVNSPQSGTMQPGNNFALALLGNNPTNQPFTAMGTPTNIQKLAICAGTISECTSNQKQPLWHYTFHKSANGRNFFTSSQPLPLPDASRDEVSFTFLGYDSLQTLVSAQTLQITRK